MRDPISRGEIDHTYRLTGGIIDHDIVQFRVVVRDALRQLARFDEINQDVDVGFALCDKGDVRPRWPPVSLDLFARPHQTVFLYGDFSGVSA